MDFRPSRIEEECYPFPLHCNNGRNTEGILKNKTRLYVNQPPGGVIVLPVRSQPNAS